MTGSLSTLLIQLMATLITHFLTNVCTLKNGIVFSLYAIFVSDISSLRTDQILTVSLNFNQLLGGAYFLMNSMNKNLRLV